MAVSCRVLFIFARITKPTPKKMNSHERAARLMVEAEKLGCDTPTEGMIAEAIHDAVEDALNQMGFQLNIRGFDKARDAMVRWRQEVQLEEEEEEEMDPLQKVFKKYGLSGEIHINIAKLKMNEPVEGREGGQPESNNRR